MRQRPANEDVRSLLVVLPITADRKAGRKANRKAGR
jgi:hypothetical protein